MFHGWDNFYFMVGSAAAGLIGLLFVVVTLTSGSDRSQVQRGQALFMTPTELNFALVLSISAVGVAPGLPIWATGAAFGFISLVGLANAAKAAFGLAAMRAENKTSHWTDFWMYGVTPCAAYVGLFVASIVYGLGAPWGPYAIAVLLLTLLLVGIRNAWDLVTWIAPNRNIPPPTS